MELKPGYKQTEVGLIPEDWELRPLKDAYSEPSRNGIYKAAEFHGRGTRIVNMGELFGIEFISDQDMDLVQLTSTESSVSELRDGDLLFGRRSVVPSGAGKCSLVISPSSPLTFESSIIRVRLTERHLWPLYGYYYFSSPTGRSLVSTIVSGTNVKGVRASELGELKIPWPPHVEQVQIAEALRSVDELLESLQQAITKKRDIKQAAMQELLTGKRRLPGFEGVWEVKRLGDAGKCLRGVSYKGESDLMAYDTATTRRLLRSNNIQGSFLTADDVKYVNSQRVAAHQIMTRGDILICMANGSKALVGKAGRFHINDGYEYTFGAFMGCFRTVAGLADPEFVSYLFQTGRYQHCVGDLLAGSSINNLKPSSIESLEFEFPSQAEQTAIAAVLSDIDTELTALEASRDKTRALKQATMQELLTGRIRLA